MTNAGSSEGVIVWHKRWCEEIVFKVIGVVRWFLFLTVIASKASVRCSQSAQLTEVDSSLLPPMTSTDRVSLSMDDNSLRGGRKEG